VGQPRFPCLRRAGGRASGLSNLVAPWLRPEEGWPRGELEEDSIYISLHYRRSIPFILICWISEKFWHRGKIEFGPKTNHNHLPPVINNLTAHIPFAYGKVLGPRAGTKANGRPWWVVLTWWRKPTWRYDESAQVRWARPHGGEAPRSTQGAACTSWGAHTRRRGTERDVVGTARGHASPHNVVYRRAHEEECPPTAKSV